MNKNLRMAIGIVIGIIVLGVFVWLARPSSPKNWSPNLVSNTPEVLAAEDAVFDFGQISMASGNVSHKFRFRNINNEIVRLERMYTSCMCTTAELVIKENSFGPYGMPGHGPIPKINQTLLPSEEAIIEIVFDPAAHGPAGVGRIERVVYLENSKGRPLELMIKAMVMP